MDVLRANGTKSHTFANTRPCCLFPAVSYLAAKKSVPQHFSPENIPDVSDNGKKLFHPHFRNKPRERVFCLMNARAIRRNLKDGSADSKEGDTDA
jgi:hypothetical protein